MKVLIDTSIWSVALRKKDNKLSSKDKRLKEHLIELIQDTRVIIIGPIRQELLSGISNEDSYNNLKEHLEAFEDISILSSDYEKAAYFFNICMKKGIQGSHTDFLICAIANNHQLPVFTTDKDFFNYNKYIDIEVYQVPEK